MKIGVIGANGRLGKIIQTLTPIFPITKDTPRISLPCDVLIDVSTAQTLSQNLKANLPIVIGTTGHSDLTPIHEASKKIPIFYAENFSLGIYLLKKMAHLLAKNFPADIDIIDSHHKTKKDAPSGTALELTKIFPNANVHSIRSAQTPGEHTIILNTPEEKLTLTHQAHSRLAFAKGALLAAQFIATKPPGLYTMEHLEGVYKVL